MTKRILARDLHREWMKRPGYAKAHTELAAEFMLADELIAARAAAGLTQAALAKRMNTTQTVVARLESGKKMPSTRTLERFANATGHKLVITLTPTEKGKRAAVTRKSA
jgi:ribosome-binding protein aMBF1 (putative translation factor)